MRRKEKTLANLIVLTVACVLLFGMLEAGLRMAFPQHTTERAAKISPRIYQPSDYTPWSLKPFAADRIVSPIGREFSVPVSINSFGIRDSEFALSDLEDKKVVAAIGDSFTFGFGVELENTYHKQLERMLDPEGKKYKFINLGFADGAYTTDIQYLYLKEKGMPKFRPNIVILGFYVGNDLADFDFNIWQFKDAAGNPLSIKANNVYIDEDSRLRRIPDRSKKSLIGNFDAHMSTWSHTYVFFKTMYIRIFISNSASNKPNSLSAQYYKNLEIAKRMLLETDRLAQAYNTTLVVMLIPSRAQVDDNVWRNFDPSALIVSRFSPQSEMLEFCRLNSIKCLDLLEPMLSIDGLYFKIDNHWNEMGHRLAAQSLFKYLVNQSLVSK